MQCLIDYIGLRDNCNFIPSTSGMYLNQLPGITIEKMDEVADEDQVTYQQLWDDIQATAADTFREDIIAELDQRWLLKQVTQTIDLDRNISTADSDLITPADNTLYGILIESAQEDEQCTCSNLQQLYVQSLSFYWIGSDESPSYQATVYDADLGTVLFEKTVTTARQGWNYIDVETTFNVRRIFVSVTGNFDSLAKLDISQFDLNNFGNFGRTWGYGGNQGNAWLYFNWGGCGCQSRVQGGSVVNNPYEANFSNIQTNANTYGISVVFSTKCGFDNVVCMDKRQFGSAWRHCLAIKFLDYVLNTDRVNRWTTIDRDEAVRLQRLLNLEYRGGREANTGSMYPGKLKVAVAGIQLDDYDCCLKNNDHYQWVESI